MQRLSEDLDWFCDKFDYRNKDADWRTSKDALPRGMQKAAGGYPADEPYTMDKQRCADFIFLFIKSLFSQPNKLKDPAILFSPELYCSGNICFAESFHFLINISL